MKKIHKSYNSIITSGVNPFPYAIYPGERISINSEDLVMNKAGCPKCGGKMVKGKCAECGYKKAIRKSMDDEMMEKATTRLRRPGARERNEAAGSFDESDPRGIGRNPNPPSISERRAEPTAGDAGSRGRDPERRRPGGREAVQSAVDTVFGKKTVRGHGARDAYSHDSEAERIRDIPPEKRVRLFLHKIHDERGKHIGYQWHPQLMPDVDRTHAGFSVSKVMAPGNKRGFVSRIESKDNLGAFGVNLGDGDADDPYTIEGATGRSMLGYDESGRGRVGFSNRDDWHGTSRAAAMADRRYGSSSSMWDTDYGDRRTYSAAGKERGDSAMNGDNYISTQGHVLPSGPHWGGQTLHTDTSDMDVDPKEYFGQRGSNLATSLRLYGTPDGSADTLPAYRALSEVKTFSPNGVPIPRGLASAQGHSNLARTVTGTQGENTSLRPDGTQPGVSYARTRRSGGSLL